STLMWNLGRVMPGLIASFGPEVIGGVAIVLALAAARRLTPGSPFDQFVTRLEHSLPDSGQFLSQPLVVQTTAHLTSGADDFLAGLLGLPQPAQRGALAGEDLVAGAAIAGLGLVGSKTLQETRVRVHQDSTSETSAPEGYRDLISRIPRADEGASQIRIEHYESGYVVYLSGTIDAGVEPTNEPWDMTSNISAIAELDSGSYNAAVQAMREAGISAEDNVIVVGHSQGGLVAAQLAASGDYRVSDVVTVGAPLHQVDIPEEVNVIAVEHAEDVIPSLSGVAVPAATAAHLTVTRSLYSTAQVPRGELLPAHNLSRYVETAAVMDRSGDSKLTAGKQQLTERMQGKATVTTWRADRVQ
ncbi:MAG: alpha/beta hydrolase, partial [Aurantimicrobium sp.]